MNLDKLKAITNKLSEEQQKSGGDNNNGEWPVVCFPPEGVTRGRFIVDPTGELYEKYYNYGYFNKGIRDPETLDPKELPEHFHNRLGELAKTLSKDHMKFSRGRKTSFLVYFYVTSTDIKDEKFKPNTLVCLVGDGRFANAFNDVLQSLMKDAADKLLNSLSPDKKGPIMEINIVRGTQGKCVISPTFSELDPLVTLTEEEQALPDDQRQKLIAEKLAPRGYKPLSISYIKPGFQQDKYDRLVTEYQAELDEIIAKKKAKAGENPDPQPESQGQDQAEPAQEQKAEEPKVSEAVPAESTPAVSETPAESVSEPKVSEPTATENPFAKYKRN